MNPIAIIVIFGLVCGMFCAILAEAKRYNAGIWFIFGVVFSILALVAAAGLPTKTPTSAS